MYDPSRIGNRPWVIAHHTFSRDASFHFAVGYPFWWLFPGISPMWEIPDIPNEQIYHHSKPKSMVKCEDPDSPSVEILPLLRSSEWQNTLSFRAYRGISNTLHYCLSNESERSLTKYSFSRRFFKTKPFRMTCVFGEKSYPMVITQQYIQGGKMIKQNGVRRKKRPRSIIL